MDYAYDLSEERMRTWNRTHIVERAVSELQGMAVVILYDGVVDNDEIIMLYKWLQSYEQESSEWPLSELRNLIEEICSDGIVTSKEREILFSFLKTFSAGPQEDAVIGGIYDDVTIVFPERTFLFTGKLQFGPRKKAQEAVLQYGGLLAPSKSVSQKLNYLVCGDLGNVNFRQSRFGNKIAKALELKDKGSSDLWIVTESKFVESIVSE
jgi:NAD-dependent DNA ligase